MSNVNDVDHPPHYISMIINQKLTSAGTDSSPEKYSKKGKHYLINNENLICSLLSSYIIMVNSITFDTNGIQFKIY